MKSALFECFVYKSAKNNTSGYNGSKPCDLDEEREKALLWGGRVLVVHNRLIGGL